MRRSGFLNKNSAQSLIQIVLGYGCLKDFGKNFLMTGVDGQTKNGVKTLYIKLTHVVKIWETRTLDTPNISAKKRLTQQDGDGSMS